MPKENKGVKRKLKGKRQSGRRRSKKLGYGNKKNQSIPRECSVVLPPASPFRTSSCVQFISSDLSSSFPTRTPTPLPHTPPTRTPPVPHSLPPQPKPIFICQQTSREAAKFSPFITIMTQRCFGHFLALGSRVRGNRGFREKGEKRGRKISRRRGEGES